MRQAHFVEQGFPAWIVVEARKLRFAQYVGKSTIAGFVSLVQPIKSEIVDVYLQAKRDGAAAKRFFKRLLRCQGGEPRKIVTDKLPSYGVAHRELIPESIHVADRYANNRAEQSHEATRVRERGMRKFKSRKQAQKFVTAHAAVSNLFNLGRHLVCAQHYRNLRMSAFAEWSRAVA